MTGENDTPKLAESEQQLETRIASLPSAPREARCAVHEMVADHPLASAHLEALTLLVSEVMTNSVTHPTDSAQPEVELSIVINDLMTRVLVTDGGTGFQMSDGAADADNVAGALPGARPQLDELPGDVMPLPSDRPEGGHGLLLLERLASRWGTLLAPGRFSVWFEIDHTGAART